MPITYDTPDQDTIDLLDQVKLDFHERLEDHDVRVGILMAHAPVDEKTGRIKGHALKGHAGTPAAAKIKAVSLKDRLTKKYDVELLIDGDKWPNMGEREKVALLDHELTHISITGKVDDLSRPVVKMRDEDFIVWGFLEVVRRHGSCALEAQSVRHLIEEHGQLLLEGITPPLPSEGVAAPVKRFKKEMGESGMTVTIESGSSKVTVALSDEDKELVKKCVDFLKGGGRASSSALQRALRLGYNRACWALSYLEEQKVVGPIEEGGLARPILVDLETFELTF